MKTIKYNLLSIAIFAVFSTAVSAGDVTGLNTFVSGTPAVAAEVNANFTAVKTAVDDNNAQVATKQNIVSGSCTIGSSIRAIAADGTVTCEEDTDTDTNTTYSAGTGMSMSGTTLNADTGYLQRRVSASCAAGSSIRAISSTGTVTCETDNNSGGDITSVTAGSGLLGGANSGNAIVSVSPGGITSTHISNGTITSSDIADGTITSSDIADGTIGTFDINDSSIYGVDIAPSTINGSDIAPDSIPSGDISNEAGLEYSQKSGEGTLNNTIYNQYVQFQTLSVTVPSTGYVTCIATGSVDRVDTTSGYSVSVGWDNVSGNSVKSFTYIRSVANGNYIIPYTSMHTFAVTLGTQNFYFKAKTSSPDNTDFDIRANSYACMFFPTRY